MIGDLERIHSTRTIRPGTELVEISIADYATLHALASAGLGVTPVNETPGQIEGLSIAELGLFQLPDDAAAHAEFRVWLNNGQRLAFPVLPDARWTWMDRFIRVLFPRACPRDDSKFAPGGLRV